MPRKARSTPKATRDTAPNEARRIAAAGGVTLSPTAKALYDDVVRQWDLNPPTLALLRLGCEAMSKAEQLEAITAAEGMTIGDAKGSAKAHPASLLARDYRSQAATTLQRILSNLGE